MHHCNRANMTLYDNDFLNLMLLLYCLPFDLSFISTQFLVLNLYGWLVASSNRFIIFWFFYFPLLYIIIYIYFLLYNYYQWFFCFSFGVIHLFLTNSSFLSRLFPEVFEILVILSVILFPIKSPVASTIFWTALFIVLIESFENCLAWSRICWLYLLL